MYVCIYTYIHIYTHIYMCVHVCIYVYVYVYIYIYMCVCVLKHLIPHLLCQPSGQGLGLWELPTSLAQDFRRAGWARQAQQPQQVEHVVCSQMGHRECPSQQFPCHHQIGTTIRRLIFGRIIGVLIANGLRGNLHQGIINNDQKQGHPPTDFQDNTETKSIENVPYK